MHFSEKASNWLISIGKHVQHLWSLEETKPKPQREEKPENIKQWWRCRKTRLFYILFYYFIFFESGVAQTGLEPTMQVSITLTLTSCSFCSDLRVVGWTDRSSTHRSNLCRVGDLTLVLRMLDKACTKWGGTASALQIGVLVPCSWGCEMMQVL